MIDKISKMDEINNLDARKFEVSQEGLIPKTNNKGKIVKESMDVAQGKLILGLNVPLENENMKYAALIYNNILGGSAMRSLRTATKSSPPSPQLEKACAQHQGPNTAKNK